LAIALFSDWSLPLAMVGLVLIIAFVAGIYPGFVLSNLIPVEIFRGKMKSGGKSRLVQGLVVLQFAISILLIVCTFVISSQMRYVGTYDLGYDQNLVVTFPTGSQGEESANLLSRFKNELSGNRAVVDVAGYAYPFGSSWLYLNYGGEGFKVLIGEDITSSGYTEDPEVAGKYFYMNWVDAQFIPTMGIQLVEGRNFADDRPADVDGAIILNETAVKQFGWDNPIGQRLPKGFRSAQVIGVVKDFHYYPLHREIQPLVLHMPRADELSSIFQIGVRIRPDDISGTLASLEKTWGDVSEGRPFQYRFLDDRVAEQYAAEQRWRRIVEYSSIFTILIACIGLFGLTSLAVSKRTREVGIRKVLGASVSRIVTMLTSDFAKLVAIANVIAWPVAYLVMNRWLQDFTYRMNLTIWVFLAAGITAIFIAVITVSFQAVKAALADPVRSLRYE
jgi:putative ABC transport system permease protein